MPTVSEVLGGVLENAIKHPKSTVQSLLTCAMVGATALLACGCVSGRVLGIVGGVLAVAKVGLGMLQTDGTQISLPPGTTATSDTHVVVTAPETPASPKV